MNTLRRAMERPSPPCIIIVVGRSNAGKTTFIDECIKAKGQEDFLKYCGGVSDESHTTQTYMFNGVTGSNQEIIFREEPSLLGNPESSYEILNEFAEFLYDSGDDSVACVVFVLDHGRVDNPQQEQDFESHLQFIRRWMGDDSPGSTILMKNREPRLPMASHNHVDFIWQRVLGRQSLGIKEGDPSIVIQSLIPLSIHIPRLKEQMRRKQLRDTEIGKYYSKQLDQWIKDAKREMKTNPNFGARRRVDLLERFKSSFKKREFPPKKR